MDLDGNLYFTQNHNTYAKLESYLSNFFPIDQDKKTTASGFDLGWEIRSGFRGILQFF